MMRKLLLATLLLASSVAHAQLLNKFGPVNGVLVGTAGNPQTAVATAASITPLFSCSADTSHFLNGLGTCTVPVGTGVTSVAQTVPAGFAIAGSPITSTGTLAISYATGQTANRVLATPDGTTGALSLRALVAGDVPPINLGSTANGGVSSATILLGTNGGTSNGFFSVVGPATSLKTFTFPNASANVLTDNALVTVPQGGIGVGTLTNHGVLLGAGTSAVSALAVMSTDTVLMGTTGANPSAAAVGNCGDATHAVSYNTTTHAWGCQAISSGGTGTVTNVATGTGLTGGPITTTGTLSVDQTSSLTWTGNEVFTTQTFLQTSATNFNPLAICANGQASGSRCFAIRFGTGGDLLLDIATDAGVPGSTILQAQRTGTVVTGVNLGNATDAPTINGNGVDMTPATSSYTGTLTGITATVTNTMKVSRQGNITCVWTDTDFTGTSNTNAMTITGTFPTGFAPAANRVVAVGNMQDNGVSNQIVGQATIAAGGTIALAKLNATPQASTSNWTTSGTKGINAGWSMCFPK